MTARVLPAVVDVAVSANPAKTTEQPAFRQVFTRATVASPEALAQALSRFERAHHDATWQARAHPMAAPLTVKNVQFTSGQVTYIEHNFGAAVNWLVVGWRSAVAAAALWESSTTGDQTDSRLALKAGATGTADLMLWRRP